MERERAQIGRAAAAQRLDRLDHFQRVADRPAEGAIHIGDDGDGLLARARADAHHRLREFRRLRHRLA